MTFHALKMACATALGVSLIGLATPAQAEILFEDHFDDGIWSPEWAGRTCCHKVVGGKVYEQDQDGDPRDALAVVHDSDTAWTDYEVTLTAAFAKRTPFEHFNIVLRSDGFRRSSGGSAGTCYQLEFFGTKGWLPNEKNRILLTRSDMVTPSFVTLYNQPWTPSGAPVALRIALQGGRIQVSIDGTPTIDVVDPDPLAFGGIGLHTVWESRSWYDDIVVQRSPAR